MVECGERLLATAKMALQHSADKNIQVMRRLLECTERSENISTVSLSSSMQLFSIQTALGEKRLESS